MIDPQDYSAPVAAIAVGFATAVAARAFLLPAVLGLFARRP